MMRIVGVVRQNDVVDGVEGVDPLALRAQDLLEQAEVFDRERQLLGAGLQKVQFFGSPVRGVPESPSSSSPMADLLPDDRNDHELANFLSLRDRLAVPGPPRREFVTCGADWANSFERLSLTRQIRHRAGNRRRARPRESRPGDRLRAGGTRRRGRASSCFNSSTADCTTLPYC